uniref:Uncharacterized protein n=1 Tax=Cucumis melo TaxID=3656 RepID=A0A9I9DA66_CUCME
MADRVHPTVDSPRPSTSSTLSDTTKPPSPPPGTYVIQLPKDQIYRVPPPENAHRFQLYTRQNRRRRNPCRSCLFCLLAILILLIILLGITVAVFYLVVRPKSPNYSIDAISPAKNVSVLRSVVRGTGVNLSSGAKNGLIESVKQRVVVLKVEIGVPIKVKVGAVKSWKMRVKVNCDVTVDELTTAAKIVKKNCDYSVKIW